MNKRKIDAMRQPIELRKHGAETGSKSKAKKLNTELTSSSRATTSQKSNKLPVDPYYWPQKTSPKKQNRHRPAKCRICLK